MSRKSLPGLSQAVYAWPTPLCFGACHSPDVVVCNLCHVLVGSVGVVNPPFASVIYKGILSFVSCSDVRLKGITLEEGWIWYELPRTVKENWNVMEEQD